MTERIRLWQTSISILSGTNVRITLESYKLSLRSAFGTSHSSTTTRTNALLSVEILHPSGQSFCTGVGESGLPPKKFGCYESDLSDIISFFSSFETHLHHQSQSSLTDSPDPLESVPRAFFRNFGMRAADSEPDESEVTRSIQWLLNCLDSFPTSPFGFAYKAAHCCFELACFDAWGKHLGVPLHRMIRSSPVSSSAKEVNSECVGQSFYTIALNDDISEMERSCAFGLPHSRFLKIKLNGDVSRCEEILQRLFKFCCELTGGIDPEAAQKRPEHQRFVWSIDANSSWVTPTLALKCLDVLKPYASHVFMVEQPFGLFRARPHPTRPNQLSYVENNQFNNFATSADDVVESDSKEASEQFGTWQQWLAVRQAYESSGLILYGDESVTSAADIEALHPLVHGVNVKLEKTAGVRGALRAIGRASELKLRVWIGTMVGSALNSTAAAHLLPLAGLKSFSADDEAKLPEIDIAPSFGDMDGALLTTPECQLFEGGMIWSSEHPGNILLPIQGGLGMSQIQSVS